MKPIVKTIVLGALSAAVPLLALLPSIAAAQPAAAPAAAAPSQAKVLRLALASRENNLDPAQVSDVISSALVASLFDAPLTYDHLARPAKLKPNTATSLPEVHDDNTRFVFRIRPGIFFPDHPAFKGQRRELVAEDYVYSIKRYYDPASRSPTLFHYENAGLLGLSELRKKAIADKKPFDYDTPVEGLRALDRYSFEIRTARPAPRLPYVLANPAIAGALAREVVELDRSTIGERPVGTGPFRVAAWTRGTRLVLERNANQEWRRYDAEPNPDDAAGQALAAKFRGRGLPMLDRVEITIVEEAQPRWLSFLNRQIDMVQLPNEFVNLAAPNGKVAPNLAKDGIRLHQEVAVSTFYTYFGMENPVVGGYTPDKVALRRAIALAYDAEREIRLLRRGQGVVPQTILPPGIPGHDPALRTEMSQHSLPRAKALLDLFGYVDKNGDGWRDMPDGSPLLIRHRTETSQFNRELQQLWQKTLTSLNIRGEYSQAQWQENIKASRAGQLMMWSTGWVAALPDASYFTDVMYGPNKGQSNHARFNLPEFNALHEKQRAMPDGPERFELVHRALKLGVAYMPMKATAHPVNSWLTHAGVVGYVPHPFVRDYWRYMDMEGPATAP
ncbi:MAG: ABC transporter substrate-binding protein [Betaproteobacteria bacterium]